MFNFDQNPAPSQASAQRSMTAGARLLLLIALFGVQFLYIPINRTIQGGVVLNTPLDDAIPLWPIWVIPYLLSLLWWAASFIWAAWRMDDDLYRAFVISVVSVMLVSYVVYILFPTYVLRPAVTGSDWPSRVVAMLYESDRVNNAFPSGHTYNSVLIALYWSRWYPGQWWLWLAITIIVLLSTLFTRQHNLPDLLGGILLAWLSYRFGLWWVARGTKGD